MPAILSRCGICVRSRQRPARPPLRWSRWTSGVWGMLLQVSRRSTLARIRSIRSAPKHAPTELALAARLPTMQSIASGNKAATNRSYHGGSLRGGYGHRLAADVVSTKGETRAERWISTEILWKWIDAHGKEFGVGRPYLDRDPPHIAPIDGKEYADHRRVNVKRAGL